MSSLAAAMSVATMNPWLIARPATFSFLAIACVLLLIDAHRQAPATRKGRWLLSAVVLLQLLWANVHGFAVLGSALLVGYAAYRSLAALTRSRLGAVLPARDGVDAPFACVVALLGLAATCVNMAGARLFTGPMQAERDFTRVTEWATTRWQFALQEQPMTMVLLVLALAALLAGRDPDTGSRVPTLWEVGLVVVAVVLGRSAVRLIAPAAVLVAPVIARRFSSLVRTTRLSAAAGHATTVTLALYLFLFPGTSWGFGFEPSHVPEGAVQFVERAGLQGRMWNFSPYGGYLSWRLYPGHRVLIDGRTGWVHEPRLVAQAFASHTQAQPFEQLVREFDLQWAVTRVSEGEAIGVPLAASGRWRMVFWDDNSAVYVRADGPNAGLALQGYRLLRHLTPLEVIAQLALRGERAADLVHDASLARQQDPDSPRAAFIGACAALVQREQPSFLQAVDDLSRLAPGHQAVPLLHSLWQRAQTVPR